jgi:hypothetical protein
MHTPWPTLHLVKSNESVIAALTRLRDFYLAGIPMPGAEAVLADNVFRRGTRFNSSQTERATIP